MREKKNWIEARSSSMVLFYTGQFKENSSLSKRLPTLYQLSSKIPLSSSFLRDSQHTHFQLVSPTYFQFASLSSHFQFVSPFVQNISSSKMEFFWHKIPHVIPEERMYEHKPQTRKRQCIPLLAILCFSCKFSWRRREKKKKEKRKKKKRKRRRRRRRNRRRSSRRSRQRRRITRRRRRKEK
jgi:hypothetical protein